MEKMVMIKKRIYQGKINMIKFHIIFLVIVNIFKIKIYFFEV